MEVWVEYTTMMHRNGVVRFRCYATTLLMLLMSAFCVVMLLIKSFFFWLVETMLDGKMVDDIHGSILLC